MWVSATAAMQTVNPVLATGLVNDVQTHPAVFLNDWSFATVSTVTHPQLVAAWAALKDPAAVKTRLSTFA